MTILLSPSDIYYTQDSIRPRFRNGEDINEVFENICNGITSVDEIPKIEVARKDDKWFSLDNRRLWLFKKLEERGKCGKILVIEVSSIPPEKYTTENEGTSIRVRMEKFSDSEDDSMYDSDDSMYDSDNSFY